MSRPHALIVDDEADIRELLEITLGRMEVETTAAESLSRALDAAGGQRFDLCLTDMRLPDGNGIDLVRYMNQHHPQTPVAMITAHGSMDTAIEALKAGAFDFVSKPVDLQALRSIVSTALKLGGSRSAPGRFLVGRSAAIEQTRATVAKLARSQAPVYISGESGTGKELVARMIHEQSPRGDGPFVPVNCGAIPEELMESELFGHKKGAFTGAVSESRGLFQSAEGGTLFLDEVADLPVPMQVKLLRAIQEKAVRPVGEERERPVDARILSASHKDLEALAKNGGFRQDLYYRLNVINLHVPALRDRREDISMLAEHVLGRLTRESGSRVPMLSEDAQSRLVAYSFPGNVRELENVLERAVALCEGNVVSGEDLGLPAVGEGARGDGSDPAPAAGQSGEVGLGSLGGSDAPPAPVADEPPLPASAGDGSVAEATGSAPPGEVDLGGDLDAEGDLDTVLEKVERQTILNALEKSRWNKTAAAKRLGISFGALRYRMQKLGLD